MASISRRTVRWVTDDGTSRTAVRFQAHYRDRGGRQHRRMFALKKAAQAWLDSQTAGLVTGQWADPQAGRVTFREFAEGWRRRQVHAATTEASIELTLRNHVYPTVGDIRLDAITTADVQTLVKTWSAFAAPTTVENRYGVLAMVLRAALRERLLPVSPCVKVKLPRIPPKSALVPISTETVLALREAMPPRYGTLVTVGAGTGMRRGEMLGLTVDRVSYDFGTIRVDRQLSRSATGDRVAFASPKTESTSRTIPVADVVIDALREHIATFGVHESGLGVHLSDCFAAAHQHAVDRLARRRPPGRHNGDAPRPAPLLRLGADQRRYLDQSSSGAARTQVRGRDLGTPTDI